MALEHMHTFAGSHVPHTDGAVIASGDQPAHVYIRRKPFWVVW